MEGADRINLLFLDDTSASLRTLIGLSPARLAQPAVRVPERYSNSNPTFPNAVTRLEFSQVSNVSSSSSCAFSDIASTRRLSLASTNSEAPSIHIAPPWIRDPPPAMTTLQYPYDLRCEFDIMFNCGVRFHPERWEEWAAHEASHFARIGPPPKTTCVFCNEVFGDWKLRMIHIGRHYDEGAIFDRMRPDFFVIERLYQENTLSKEDYDYYMSYTERPHCDGLVREGFKTPEMKARERQRASLNVRRYDLEKEERQSRRQKGRGKSERAHKSSKKVRVDISYEPRP